MQPRQGGLSGSVFLFIATLFTLCITIRARRHFTHATHDSDLLSALGHGVPRVALAIQGRSADAEEWIKLYSDMHARDRVSLFFLTFDEAAKCPPGVFCYHRPGTTWSQGRNELGLRIFQREEETGEQFKYWAFHDSDTYALDCWVCR
jgi:hypothetical protein